MVNLCKITQRMINSIHQSKIYQLLISPLRQSLMIRCNLTRKQASNLFRQFQITNQLGSGIIQYANQKIQHPGIAYLLCSLQQLYDDQFGKNVCGQITLGIKIEPSCLVSFSFFEQYFEDFLIRINPVKSRVKVVSLEWSQDANHQQLVAILKYIQKNSFLVLLNPHFNSLNWQAYQKQLLMFSTLALEHEYLVLSSLGVLLQLPDFLKQQEIEKSIKKLLCIWKRILPVGLGRLVIHDWIDSFKNKPIQKLFFIKDVRLCWKLQYITKVEDNITQLSGQILGIQ